MYGFNIARVILRMALADVVFVGKDARLPSQWNPRDGHNSTSNKKLFNLRHGSSSWKDLENAIDASISQFWATISSTYKR